MPVQYSINCDTKTVNGLVEEGSSDDGLNDLALGDRMSSTNSKTSFDGTNSQSDGHNNQCFQKIEKSA